MQFDNFNNIDNKELRTWNRCATVFNIMARHGTKVLAKYLSNFTEVEQDELKTMFKRIKEEGYDFTRAAINRQATSVAA